MSEKKLKVLFVGNSYTFYYYMPETLFVEAAAAQGYEVEVTEVTCGGAFLSQFADPEHSEGKSLREAINGKHFDCAVLQDESRDPIENEENFLKGAKGVIDLVDADKFVLYATWGRNDNSPELVDLGLTREEMTEKLSLAYNKAAKLYGAKVAEVGKAFLEYSKNHDVNDLYDEDMSHPSKLGSEIAAKVIFEQVK